MLPGLCYACSLVESTLLPVISMSFIALNKSKQDQSMLMIRVGMKFMIIYPVHKF